VDYKIISIDNKLLLDREKTKAFCRVKSTLEDSLFDTLIESVTNIFEAETYRFLKTKKIELIVSKDDLIATKYFYPTKGSVIDIVTVTDEDGKELEVKDFIITGDKTQKISVPKGLASYPITFEMNIGYTPESLPKDLELAMMQTISSMYENRNEGQLPKLAIIVINDYKIRAF
jgi:uncharacterized phiE125 gp8 family phage protein